MVNQSPWGTRGSAYATRMSPVRFQQEILLKPRRKTAHTCILDGESGIIKVIIQNVGGMCNNG